MGLSVSERRWLRLILALYCLLGAGYSLLMPVWEGPDENAHYLIALQVARRGTFPTIDWNYEAYQPPLYYLLAAGPLRLMNEVNPALVDFYQPQRHWENVGRPVRIFDWNDGNYRILWGALALRWINLLAGGVALIFLHRGARRLLPESKAIPMAAVALAGLNPQFLHIAASVSNDALAILAGSFLFWVLSRLCCEDVRRPMLALAAAAAVLLPVFTKLTALPMGIVVLLAAARHVFRARGAAKPAPPWAIAVLGVALVAGMLLLTPRTASVLLAEFQWRGLSLRVDAFQPQYLAPMIRQVLWSFWGKVGWLAVGLPEPLVAAVTALAALGALASLRQLLREGKGWMRSALQALTLGVGVILTALYGWWLLPGWVLGAIWVNRRRIGMESSGSSAAWVWLWIAAELALIVVARNGLTTNRNQGRFLFPSLGPLALLIASGWSHLLPQRLAPYLPHLVLGLTLALNALLWLGGIIPIYYQPFMG